MSRRLDYCQDRFLDILASILFNEMFLEEHRVVLVHYPTYLPDLALCKFFLFHKLKNHENAADAMWSND